MQFPQNTLLLPVRTRHLGSILGVCYAGKDDDWEQTNSLFTCITDNWYGSYAGKRARSMKSIHSLALSSKYLQRNAKDLSMRVSPSVMRDQVRALRSLASPGSRCTCLVSTPPHPHLHPACPRTMHGSNTREVHTWPNLSVFK